MLCPHTIIIIIITIILLFLLVLIKAEEPTRRRLRPLPRAVAAPLPRDAATESGLENTARVMLRRKKTKKKGKKRNKLPLALAAAAVGMWRSAELFAATDRLQAFRSLLVPLRLSSYYYCVVDVAAAASFHLSLL